MPVKRHEFFSSTKSECETLLYVTCFARKLPSGNATKILICELHLDRPYRRPHKVMKHSCVFFMKAASCCFFFCVLAWSFPQGFRRTVTIFASVCLECSTMKGVVRTHVETQWKQGILSSRECFSITVASFS